VYTDGQQAYEHERKNSMAFSRSRRQFLGLIACCAVAFHTIAWGGEKTRVACVGDSITFGAGIKNRAQNSYPVVLGKLLGADYEVRNFGVSGTTLLKKGDRPYWKTKQFKQATEFAPNIVVIKLGTNDTKPQNTKVKEQFEGDLTAMVDHFAGLPGKPKIFLCLPVPVYKTRWGINAKDLAYYMPIIKKVAEAKDTGLIDLHTALSNQEALFPDKIHPNAEGAKKMAQTIAAVLQKEAAPVGAK
jgi:lysophospholipase L1-like esterase